MTGLEVLWYAAGLARDLFIFLLLGTAAMALALIPLRLALRKKQRLPPRLLRAAIVCLVVGAAGCLAPVERGLAMERSDAISVLAVGAMLWAAVLLIYWQFARQFTRR